MKERCYNTRRHNYKDYGGRGIKVCDEWRNDYVAFLSHIGRKPSNYHTLDRIDVNGNYEPGNVRWATKAQQQRNKRLLRNNRSGTAGVHWHKNINRWQVDITVDDTTVYIGTFTNLAEAVAARRMAEATYHE